MKITALLLLALASLIHVYIFLMESIWWATPKINKVFKVSPEEAQIMKGFAFNQGYYNLFLAIEIMVGIFFWLGPNQKVGVALCSFGAGSMLAAALVLLASAPHLIRAATIQGGAPLVSLILILTMYLKGNL